MWVKLDMTAFYISDVGRGKYSFGAKTLKNSHKVVLVFRGKGYLQIFQVYHKVILGSGMFWIKLLSEVP